MIKREIRMLFLSYAIEKTKYQMNIGTETEDKKLKALNKRIEKLNKLQLDLIQQYIAEVDYDLPLEMQSYFSGENIY